MVKGGKSEFKLNFLNVKVGILIILIILLGVSLYYYFPKNCKSSLECFEGYAQKCRRAQIGIYNEGNLFKYEIKGGSGDNCILNVELVKLKEGSNSELVELLQGRDMLCSVPKDVFSEKTVMEIKELSNYCSGPLKEAMLQLTIERLYSVIISNLGNITAELRKVA